MDRMLRGSGLRAAGIAALAFAVMLFAASTPSAAASYTLNFVGTATAVEGAFATLGVGVGDPISGTLTFDPFNTAPSSTMPPFYTVFSQTSATFSFHVSDPSLDLTMFSSSDGFIASSRTSDHLIFAAGPLSSQGTTIDLDFRGQGTGSELTSLAGLPTTSAGLVSFLGGGLGQASGTFGREAGNYINFDIDLVTTPIPATLPLFASALGGLGFFGWKRRKSPAAA
jgi:hypothetical protein